jgi:hypothetical protein
MDHFRGAAVAVSSGVHAAGIARPVVIVPVMFAGQVCAVNVEHLMTLATLHDAVRQSGDSIATIYGKYSNDRADVVLSALARSTAGST